jgi:hypothetical protein
MKAWATGQEWYGRRYLISPLIDFLFAGGIPFLMMPLLFVVFPLLPDGSPDPRNLLYVSSAFAVLAYVANHPHFMVSYQIMYSGFRQKLNTHRQNRALYWRYISAGIVVPVALLLYLLYAFIAQDKDVFTIGVQILFFTVGWHYVKQAFGIFVMLSALKGIYYGKQMRRLLLANGLLVWMLSWLGGNIWVPGYEQNQYDFWGVSYTPLGIGLPPYFIQFLQWAVIGYGVMVVVAILAHALSTKTRPSATAIAGYASMYTLLLLSYYHPLWVYMTPFLHSAQYLLFVVAYKRGESRTLIARQTPEAEVRKQVERFMLIAFLLGLLLFTGIPRSLGWLTTDLAIEHGLFLPFLYAFTVFINIHHYFIDNVIWRKENREVGQYVFHP